MGGATAARSQSVRYRSRLEQHRSHRVTVILGAVRTQLRPSRPPLRRLMDTGVCKNVRKRVRSFEKVRNNGAAGQGWIWSWIWIWSWRCFVRRGFCCFWSRSRRRARYFTHTRSGFFCGDIMRKPRVGLRQTAGGEGARRVSTSMFVPLRRSCCCRREPPAWNQGPFRMIPS